MFFINFPSLSTLLFFFAPRGQQQQMIAAVRTIVSNRERFLTTCAAAGQISQTEEMRLKGSLVTHCTKITLAVEAILAPPPGEGSTRFFELYRLLGDFTSTLELIDLYTQPFLNPHDVRMLP